MASTTYPNEPAVLSLPAVPEPVLIKPAEKHSYGQILKSSVLVGGSSFLNIAIGILRTKAMAFLLGPSGFGLFGLYGSIADLTQSLAGLGVNSSGVRQIAEAAGSEDAQKIGETSAVLRRVSVLLGMIGAGFLIVFARYISELTFVDPNHALAISLLSAAVFFKIVSAGQGAMIQGMRRISDLAKMGVLGAIFGAALTIPIVYVFREKGIVPSLVGIAAMTIGTSWWYSRNIRVAIPSVTLLQMWHETSSLLKLGFAFMSSGLMTMGVAYVVRVTVLRKVGYEATGLYQSAWTLGGLYVGFILQAMGADFYPRLTASIRKNAECNRLVNEQMLIGLLLAGPGVIATLAFAPAVVAIFYSAKFGAAVGVLRWICLGATLQVITWPMGFIIVAKGKPIVFFCAELAWTIVAVCLAWLCVGYFGLSGAGMAFFGSYVFHALLIYPIVRSMSGFHWSAQNKRTTLFFLSLITAVFCGFYVLPFYVACTFGGVMVLLTGAYSLHTLLNLMPFDRLPAPIQRLCASFPIFHSGSHGGVA